MKIQSLTRQRALCIYMYMYVHCSNYNPFSLLLSSYLYFELNVYVGWWASCERVSSWTAGGLERGSHETRASWHATGDSDQKRSSSYIWSLKCCSPRNNAEISDFICIFTCLYTCTQNFLSYSMQVLRDLLVGCILKQSGLNLPRVWHICECHIHVPSSFSEIARSWDT